MKLDRKQLLLYAITDRSWLRGKTLYEQVEAALKGGVTMLQLREKGLGEDALYREAVQIKDLCDRYAVPLIINDDVQLAKRVDADGVHLGQGDMDAAEARAILGEEKIIGVSARTVDLALEAQAKGADYLGSGAVFATSSKGDAIEVGPARLREICAAVEIPVVAIGGINGENVTQLAGSGIAGVAVISAVFAAEDVQVAARELRETVGAIV